MTYPARCRSASKAAFLAATATGTTVKEGTKTAESSDSVTACHVPFLNFHGPSRSIALFDRDEISLGSLVGSGSFANVYDIARIALKTSNGANRHATDVEECRVAFYRDTGNEDSNYVIKLIREMKSIEMYERARKDLLLEAAYLTVLDHPNIVKARALHTGRTPFLVLDKLRDTLVQRIEDWKLGNDSSLAARSHYGLQIAEAVQYLHQHRIILRDLKPPNIGFTGADIVQLFDFGLCRALEAPKSSNDETFQMSKTGTRRYMAPEIYCTGKYGLKADVYSWAVVFYEMLTLAKPYEGYHVYMFERFVCVDGERPPLDEHKLPTSLVNLIQKSWAQEVRKRHSMAAVCAELRGIVYNTMDTNAVSPKRESGVSLRKRCLKGKELLQV